MAIEIELKFSLPEAAIPELRALPCLRGLPMRRCFLKNIYLDTPAAALRAQKMAVRRRGVWVCADATQGIVAPGPETWFLTVKTAGTVDAALARRQEWESPLARESPLDFSIVDDTGLRTRLTELEPYLQTVFQVNFWRDSWHIEADGSRLELVLDEGFIRAGSRQEALWELELELLAGHEATLMAWGARLRQDLPAIMPQTVSKAARGYSLAGEAYAPAAGN
jgi:inorganic triphosphatase YgiF